MEEQAGVVFQFFVKPMVAAISTEVDIKKGDKVHFLGATTDFVQKLESMQIDLKPVEEVAAGKQVGIKVKERVRPGDKMLLIRT
ncbi:translation elongation factor-like protein [Candidatus Woesearchaeota archaeon]|nr:translation elongation factor-like protein [Candidatus Woesearchaeota archaeon]